MEHCYFVHGGPGLCAEPERRLMQHQPNLYLCDQPRIASGSPHAYQSLLDANAEQFCRIVDSAGPPVAVAATSFGVHLALDLVARYPAHVARLILLAPTLNPHKAYLRLADRVLRSHPNDVLQAQILAAQRNPRDSNAFWALIGTVLTTPNLVDLYWGEDRVQHREQFKALLGAPGNFDYASFYGILDDFLFKNPPSQAPLRFAHPVTAVFGKADILLDPEQDAAILQRYLPQTTFEYVSAGHFLHLELNPARWIHR